MFYVGTKVRREKLIYLRIEYGKLVVDYEISMFISTISAISLSVYTQIS
jgi:hypothetical protein